MSALTVSGSGTLVPRGSPRFTDTWAQTGSGTLALTLVSSTALAEWWTGSVWQTAPIWTWSGSAWRITNLQIIRSAGNPTHGMYAGGGNIGTSAINAFNGAKGTHITLAHDIADWTSWQTLTSTTPLTAWNTWCGVSPARRLVYSIGLLTATDDAGLTVQQKYQNLAFGLYDTYFAALGATFQSMPNLRDATIKLGSRVNRAGLSWSIPAADQDTFLLYTAAYNRVAALMKAACPTLTFEWNPNSGLGSAQRSLTDLYPGDNFVDYIGLTLYDNETDAAGAGASETTRFNWLQTSVNGLNDQVALATTRGKRPVLSNWGLIPASDPTHGGGDDPNFIDSIISWMVSNNYAYSVYNNTNLLNGNIDSRLAIYPAAMAEYVAQFLTIGG